MLGLDPDIKDHTDLRHDDGYMEYKTTAIAKHDMDELRVPQSFDWYNRKVIRLDNKLFHKPSTPAVNPLYNIRVNDYVKPVQPMRQLIDIDVFERQRAEERGLKVDIQPEAIITELQNTMRKVNKYAKDPITGLPTSRPLVDPRTGDNITQDRSLLDIVRGNNVSELRETLAEMYFDMRRQANNMQQIGQAQFMALAAILQAFTQARGAPRRRGPIPMGAPPQRFGAPEQFVQPEEQQQPQFGSAEFLQAMFRAGTRQGNLNERLFDGLLTEQTRIFLDTSAPPEVQAQFAIEFPTQLTWQTANITTFAPETPFAQIRANPILIRLFSQSTDPSGDLHRFATRWGIHTNIVLDIQGVDTARELIDQLESKISQATRTTTMQEEEEEKKEEGVLGTLTSGGPSMFMGEEEEDEEEGEPTPLLIKINEIISMNLGDSQDERLRLDSTEYIDREIYEKLFMKKSQITKKLNIQILNEILETIQKDPTQTTFFNSRTGDPLNITNLKSDISHGSKVIYFPTDEKAELIKSEDFEEIIANKDPDKYGIQLIKEIEEKRRKRKGKRGKKGKKKGN